MSALVHDIGKLSVPAEILNKPGVLSANEFALIRQHPTAGFEILKDIAFPWPVAESVLQHHERMDGSGYPQGLLGDDICRTARILAVADAVEAMSSHRPYRPGLGIDAAIAEITDHPAKYDPDVVAACLRLHESGLIAW
jgi:HD-GYP domain-containing protein (c-di-GMP phosphodiesterase class II)